MIYWRVGQYPFINFDDDLYITDNHIVLKGLTWEGIEWALKSVYPNWHPLTWISHMIDVEFYGLNSGFHHIENAMIHVITSILLFLSINHATGDFSKSAFVAILFAVHPLHVESVVWISERKNILCGLFWVLTLFAYSVYVTHGGIRRYFSVIFFFTLGLLSKPMIVTLPFVLMLLDYWPLGRVLPDERECRDFSKADCKITPFSRLFREKIPFIVLMVFTCTVTYISQITGGNVSHYPFGIRVANAIVSWVAYIPKLIWPTSMAVFYPHPWLEHRAISNWDLGFAIMIISSITLLVILLVRRGPYLAVGWFWYLGTLIPVIGLIQVGNQAMADRYAYIPSIGIFIMIAWGLPDLVRGWSFCRYILISLGIIYISSLMFITTSQISYWRSSVSLFEHAMEVIPNNWRIQVNLGQALLEEGRVKEAITEFETMLSTAPNHEEALPYKALTMNGIGIAYETQGEYDNAMEQYLEALRMYPGLVVANNNLGEMLSRQGRHKEAIYYFKQALKHGPTSAVANENLLKSMSTLGMTDQPR